MEAPPCSPSVHCPPSNVQSVVAPDVLRRRRWRSGVLYVGSGVEVQTTEGCEHYPAGYSMEGSDVLHYSVGYQAEGCCGHGYYSDKAESCDLRYVEADSSDLSYNWEADGCDDMSSGETVYYEPCPLSPGCCSPAGVQDDMDSGLGDVFCEGEVGDIDMEAEDVASQPSTLGRRETSRPTCSECQGVMALHAFGLHKCKDCGHTDDN